jgi:hypothetical protein
MGDVHESSVDDLKIDEQPQDLASPAQGTPGDESFPDPDLDDTPEESLSSSEETGVPAAEASAGYLPEPPLPPPPAAMPPIDGGFTPYTPPRTEQPSTPAMQFFTPAQLRQGVEQGLITEDQMVEQLQLQNRELAKQEALKAIRQETVNQSITRQLNEFRHLVPGWDQVGSHANKQATPAYQELLSRGFPDDDNTRLLALERTFGTVNRIKDARVAQTRTASLRETTRDVGRRGSPPPSGKRKDPLEILSLDEKRLYKQYIEKGLYADWNAVRKEVQHAATQTVNPRLREKHAGLMK